MGMKGQMWWNIDNLLWSIGWGMNDASIDGTTMEWNSHAPMDSQSQVRLDTFTSSWSLTMNQPFSRMMSATWDGAMQPASQNWRPKAMARCWWCQISWHQIGDDCAMGISEFPLSHHLAFSHPLAKPGSSSNLEKIMKGILTLITLSHMSIMPSISLMVSLGARLKASFYSTMHPAIKSMHQMLYQHEICQKVR